MTPRRADDEEVAGLALARVGEARALMACHRVPGVARPAALFYLALALRLEPVPSWEAETFATDGRKLFFNPGVALRLPQAHLFGVLAHEALHAGLAHHARRGGRDLALWNVACDLALNPHLTLSGFALPGGSLAPGRGEHAGLPEGLSAEEYYDLLSKGGRSDEQQGGHGGQGAEAEDATGGAGGGAEGAPEGEGAGQGEGGQGGQGAGPEAPPQGGRGDGFPDPGGSGGVIDAPAPAEMKQEEARARVALAQAAQAARSMGDLPGWLERLVGEALRPREDWRETLREFVSRHARQDHSWSRPNRRFAQQGVYLPGLQGEELGDVIVTVDCSGSIDQRQLDVFAAEVRGVAEVYGCDLLILYHDVPVTHVQRWGPGDGPLKLRPHGGGGTSHRPVFGWIAERGGVEAPDAPCVLCFTDMQTDFPAGAPALPVLWCAHGDKRYFNKPPFGRVVEVRG